MKIDWTFSGCDEADEMEVERIWEQVQIELEGKLKAMRAPASHLRIAVEQNDSGPLWVTTAALHLPASSIVAEGAAETASDALNQLLAELAQRIDQREDDIAEKPLSGRGTQEMAELLTNLRSKGQSEIFLSFLMPLAVGLGPYVLRELQLRETEGALTTAEVSTYDVIDEVLLLAWEKFPQQDGLLDIDLWLVQLADGAMDRLGSALADGSLDDEAEPPQTDRGGLERDEWEEWFERVAHHETQVISELLPGQQSISTWDELDWETRQTRMAELLQGINRPQRQAIVLNIVYGYNAGQIADFQGRSTADVEEDIAQGIVEVRRKFDRHEADDWEESFARQQMRAGRRRNGR